MPLNFNGTEIGTLKMGTTEISNAKMGSTNIYNNEIIIPKPLNASTNHIAAAFVVGKKIILQTASVTYNAQQDMYTFIRPMSHDPSYKNIIIFNADNQSPSWVSKSSSTPINHRVSTLVGDRIISFRGESRVDGVNNIGNNMYMVSITELMHAYSFDIYNESFKTSASWTRSSDGRISKGYPEGLNNATYDYVVDWYDHPILYLFQDANITGFEISSGYDYVDNTFSSPSTTSIISSSISGGNYTTDLTRYYPTSNTRAMVLGYANFNYCAKVLKTNSSGYKRYSKILIGGYNSTYLKGVLDAGGNNTFKSTNIPLQRGDYRYYPKEVIRRIFPAEPCQYNGYTYYGQHRKSGDLWYMDDFTGFEIFKPSSSDIDETTPILSVVFNNELVYFNQYTGDVYQWNKKRWLKNGTVIS